MRHLILFTVFLLLSCGADKQFDLNQIEGRWEVMDAQRDGRSTGTLEGGYFHFTTENQFSTNVFGEEKSYPFEFKGNKINQRDGDKLSYSIESIEGDTMNLATWYKNFHFNFKLVKKTEG